jgi:pimeloyl-ACP methyl ester carboxylesterase
MIDDARGRIDYNEQGEGPTVVLVPGSFSTGAAWQPVIAQWDNNFRCVTTSLLGYGATVERRHALDADIAHEAEVVESVVRRTACPVHLVGHSFGGLVALAAAIRNRLPLLSLTIIEAPFAEILPVMGEHRLYRAFREMSDAYLAAHRAGEPAAVERVVDFYGRTGTFAAWPRRVRDYAIATTPANILDAATIYGFHPEPDLLAMIEVPTLVLWGEAGHPGVRRANELLGRCIPGASAIEVSGVGHFMTITHPEKVAPIIAEHVIRAEQLNGLIEAGGARASGSCIATADHR